MSVFSENKPIIKQGVQGEYYEIDGFKYTGTFPYEWALDHKWHTEYEGCGSGPKHCANCNHYGSINGVFVFYCANCVNQIYDGVMYPKRNEICAPDFSTDEELWEACPYMRGIPRDRIGDKAAEKWGPQEWGDNYLAERQLRQAARERYWDTMYDENDNLIDIDLEFAETDEITDCP